MSNLVGLSSLYARRARLAFDSMLSFNGVDQYVDCGVNDNVKNAVDYDKDFSISLFIHITQVESGVSLRLLSQFDVYSGGNSRGVNMFISYISGNEYAIHLLIAESSGAANSRYFVRVNKNFKINKIYHVAVNHYGASSSGQWFINGVSESSYVTTNGVVDASVQVDNWPLRFGIPTSASSWNGNINYLTFFNRTLTETEIRSIHQLGGVLPESTHEACVGNYVAQPGARKMWDVVGQYNYAKVTQLEAHHGQFINFSDAELAKTDTYTSSAYVDLYSKQTFAPFVDTDENGTYDSPLIEKKSLLPPLQNALRFDGVSQYLSFPASYTPNTNVGHISASFIGQDFPIDLFNILLGSIGRGMSLFVNGSGEIETRLEFSATQNRSKYAFPNGQTATVELNTINSLVWACDGSKWLVYLNGILLTQLSSIATARYFFQDLRLVASFGSLEVTIASVSTNNYRKQIILDFHLGDYLPTRQDVAEWHNNSLLGNWKGQASLKYNFNQITDDAGTYKILDQSGNGNDAVLTNYTANQADPTHKEYQAIPIEALRDNETHYEIASDTSTPISQQMTLEDGTTNPTDTYIFDGALPTGATLSATGLISGTASETGTFELLVRLVDGSGGFQYKRVKITIT